MFTTLSIKAIPLAGLASNLGYLLQPDHARRHMQISSRIAYQFSHYSALVLIIGTLMLDGCSTTGGPNTLSGSSPGVIVSEAQAGEATPKAAEESRPNPEICAVVGAIIGGAIGIAVAAPTCNPITGSICPMAILLVGGSMAALGGTMGAHICSEQPYKQ
jgi:hypothetical protein